MMTGQRRRLYETLKRRSYSRANIRLVNEVEAWQTKASAGTISP